MQLTVIYHKH